MTAKEQALELFQTCYYDAIDRGNASAAVSIFTHDVYWSHLSAWQSDELGFSLTDLDQFYTREDVLKFLSVACPNVVESGLRHLIHDLVADGDRGAFICEVTSNKKPDVARFLVWYELAGSRVSRYLMRPL
ncbi:nuclear transport factor 2 family protein [Rhodococcus sp. 14C212]|uniref:nuclear transport factor 2 family protein n=1 Tax=Rhodococcus sp. 14C212 TaxID=2711209 RepID=UPI0013E9A302|nr:nuclear transport factor 2 family protein [Rhodococcus sp. 14C212]NGP09497.1 nuclear transport factor 2 family protein [Rhodococcus sp. 14C212]